jgi:hypothetical protein
VIWVFFINFLLLSAQGAETDQLTCRVPEQGCPKVLLELRDSSPALNSWMNDRIAEIVSVLNQRKTNRRPIDIFAEGFRGYLQIAYTPIESWAIRHQKALDFWTPVYDGVYRTATVRDMGVFGYAPVWPTLKVGRVLTGLDKLSHFLAQGWEFYRRYEDTQDYRLSGLTGKT